MTCKRQDRGWRPSAPSALRVKLCASRIDDCRGAWEAVYQSNAVQRNAPASQGRGVSFLVAVNRSVLDYKKRATVPFGGRIEYRDIGDDR